MSLPHDFRMYLRFAAGLGKYASRRLTQEEAKQIIAKRIQNRETNFLRLVKRGIFDYPQSPYQPMMKLAGCEFGDIRQMVNARGLEATLLNLRQAGVHVSFEELKGRKPVVRQGRTISVEPQDFENPFSHKHYQAETGGSTGAGRRIPLELDHLGGQAPQQLIARQAHGCLDSPSALWRGPIPDGTGINYMLRAIRYGNIPLKWYTAHLKGDARPRLTYRLATWFFVNTLRLHSVPLPRPEPLHLDRAFVLARWARDQLKKHGNCCIMTPAGRAIRICMASREEGIDLSGAVFMTGGEPITPAKARAIEDSGARFFPVYSMYELGNVGLGCARPKASDDMHINRDCFGLITHPRPLPGNGKTVQALNFTTLLPTAPLIMLNAEIDDYAVLEERSCGCALEEVGYSQHVRQVGSYTKLVSEGVNLVGSDVVRVLEEVLPAQFGGGPLDYQLLEEEDPGGIPRVYLLASPRLQIPDHSMLLKAFWEELKEGPDSYAWSRSLWSQGQTLQVRRQEPFSTSRGKHVSVWRKKNGE